MFTTTYEKRESVDVEDGVRGEGRWKGREEEVIAKQIIVEGTDIGYCATEEGRRNHSSEISENIIIGSVECRAEYKLPRE